MIRTKVYRFGGLDDVGNNVDTTAIYDAVMGKWDETKVQPLPEARSRIGAAVVGDDIFLFGGYQSEVLKYLTAMDSYAVVALIDNPNMYDVTAAAVTTEDGTAKIFYGSMSYYSGFYVYEPAADKHSVIDADISDIKCLASSNDGKEVWGMVGTQLYAIDTSTGARTTFSDDDFTCAIHTYWNQCAMTSDGLFYFLTKDESGTWTLPGTVMRSGSRRELRRGEGRGGKFSS